VGATKVVTDETFEEQVLKNSKPVIVDYWAEWCGPCRMVAPILEEIAAEHADKIDVVKLNIDENPAISQRYEIMAIPTMSVFSGGEALYYESKDGLSHEEHVHVPAIGTGWLCGGRRHACWRGGVPSKPCWSGRRHECHDPRRGSAPLRLLPGGKELAQRRPDHGLLQSERYHLLGRHRRF